MCTICRVSAQAEELGPDDEMVPVSRDWLQRRAVAAHSQTHFHKKQPKVFWRIISHRISMLCWCSQFLDFFCKTFSGYLSKNPFSQLQDLQWWFTWHKASAKGAVIICCTLDVTVHVARPLHWQKHSGRTALHLWRILTISQLKFC